MALAQPPRCGGCTQASPQLSLWSSSHISFQLPVEEAMKSWALSLTLVLTTRSQYPAACHPSRLPGPPPVSHPNPAPHSLRVIRFLSISRLRSLPAHLATKLSTHSCGKGGAKRGTVGSWANMEMCREQGYELSKGIRLPRGKGASSRPETSARSGRQILEDPAVGAKPPTPQSQAGSRWSWQSVKQARAGSWHTAKESRLLGVQPGSKPPSKRAH